MHFTAKVACGSDAVARLRLLLYDRASQPLLRKPHSLPSRSRGVFPPKIPLPRPAMMATDEDITDAPVEGFYKTSVSHGFPRIESKNPVDVKLGPYETEVYNIVSNYEDLLLCRRHPEDQNMRLIYCAHALNHCLRSRKLIVKNNEKEKRIGVSDELRDQGFHRARVLILTPTKEAARRVVHTFLALMPKGSTVSHRKRFERDFGPLPGETDKEKRLGRKPKDYEEWFSCNVSDHFRIGIAFAKKSVKLYSAFADSDLILASPLGLQSIIEEEK
ncbi:unnamed protein product [Echinostoma caproni]|uniref:Helicase C-terminal domain-containing protein n=1 Tax=Echinostoma caproni TaxID=27848 RepID=A0A183AWK1_9TREM|nr:unnamed protein product [Echinostoma caproni]